MTTSTLRAHVPTTATTTATTTTTASPAGPRRTGRRFALLGHAPALDGLRGVAVLVVVVFHFVGHDVLRGGWAGVDLFFGLSGFLITALVLDEVRVHGRLSLRRVYARRALRLLPALLLLLAVWCSLLLAFHDQTWMGATPSGDGTGRTIEVGGALRDVGVALLYVANWNVISGGMEAPLSHLWSLAVEEQFYLVWPGALVLLLTLAARWRLVAVGALMAGSAALPFLLWNGGEGHDRIYFGTDTRAVGLLAGAFAALVWHRRHSLGKVARWGTTRAWVAVAVIAYVLWTSADTTARFLVFPATMALLVSQLLPALADGRGVLARALTQPWLVWAGKRSYALYLWHYLWATWTHPLGVWPGMALGIAGALACTQVSWVLVESPALRYAKRFAVTSAHDVMPSRVSLPA